MDACAVTSLWSESVSEYIIEDCILRKKTVSLAIEVPISQEVERCQLILCYSPFCADLSPQKVIMSEAKDSGKLRDTDAELVAFNGEVDGGFIPIATSSSGAELSYQLRVLFLIHAKDIKYSKRVSLGDYFVEQWITLVLHIGPINVELWGNRILLFLDNCEIPISLEVVPEMEIMQLGGPIKWILIMADHGLIFSQSEVRRPARIAMIHSSQDVFKARLEWALNFLNFISNLCISCGCRSTTISDPLCFLIGLGGACFTSAG
jgi:hypothetical protein